MISIENHHFLVTGEAFFVRDCNFYLKSDIDCQEET
jgi:hypothetical protein